MTETPPDPVRPADDEARAIAHTLLAEATHAALAVTEPAAGAPHAARIALALSPDGAPISLISELSAHTTALLADPRAALLVGEPGERGDPLTHPRITLNCRARILVRDTDEHEALLAHYVAERPKARLYAGFTDFRIAVFEVEGALLNAGFGRAHRLRPADLSPPGTTD